MSTGTTDSKLKAKATKEKHLLFGMMPIQLENISECLSNEIGVVNQKETLIQHLCASWQ
jgi:hypothetical protein